MTTAFETHNHKTCKDDIMAEVEAVCAKNGFRLTQIRKQVLRLLLQSHKAMGAYELLSELAKDGVPAQPPIVYRALSFLTEHGFAHKVETRNAYIACEFPNIPHKAGFLICRKCEAIGECCVQETALCAEDFVIENEVIEAQGLCQNCNKEGMHETH